VANPDPRVPPPEAHVPDASPATAPPIQPPAPPPVQAPDAIAPAADDVPPFGTERDTPNAAAPLQAEVVVPAPPAAVPAGDRLVPQGAALAIAAPPVPAVPDAGPASAPSPPRAAADRDAADCRIAGTDVLLHRPVGADADAWVVGGEGTPLELPIDLVAPPFSRSQLVVDDTTITLQPGTRAVLTRDPDGTPRLEVVFGAAAVAGAARIGVTTGGLVGMVAAGPASPVGVEVTLDRRPGAPAESTERFARIMPAAGGMAWQPVVADGVAAAEQTVAAGQAIVWRSGAADAASIRPAPTPPDWLAGRPLGDGIDRQAAQSLLPRLAAGVPAKPALRDLADGRRPEQRLAAAATLAVLGEFDELARLLTADGPAALRDGQWERLDLVAVQPTLARGPKAADAFAQAIAAHGPPGSADTIVRFARGLGDDEVAAGGDAELVAALESPHLAVRRYAIANLVGITGAGNADRLHYRADWPDADLRAKGVAWWRTRLEQGRIRRGGAER
jgi:hypothetical protein